MSDLEREKEKKGIGVQQLCQNLITGFLGLGKRHKKETTENTNQHSHEPWYDPDTRAPRSREPWFNPVTGASGYGPVYGEQAGGIIVGAERIEFEREKMRKENLRRLRESNT